MIWIKLDLPRRVVESSAVLVDTVVDVVSSDATDAIIKKSLNSETRHGSFPKVFLTWSPEWKRLNHLIIFDFTRQEGIPPPILVRGQRFHSGFAGILGCEDHARTFFHFDFVEEPCHLVWAGVIGQHAAGKSDIVHVDLRCHWWGQAAKGYFSVPSPSDYSCQTNTVKTLLFCACWLLVRLLCQYSQVTTDRCTGASGSCLTPDLNCWQK